jgi:hypothetical protein
MGYKLGEAPEGWAPVWDARYVTWGTVVVTLHLLVIILFAAFYSPDPWAFLGNTGMAMALVITAMMTLVAIAYRYSSLQSKQSMKLARNFRVKDTGGLSDELFNDLPRQFYPVKRKDTSEQTFPGPGVHQAFNISLAEHDGVLMSFDLVVKHDRHFVKVVVATSEADSHETRDLLDDLVEFFDERSMDWLSVDVKEDKKLLRSMGKGTHSAPAWEVPVSLSARRSGLGFWVGLVLFFWLCIVLSILDPEHGFLLVLATVGTVIFPILVGAFIIFIDDHVRYRRLGVAYEYKRDFHASPWYVTAAIDEGLRRAGRAFTTRRRIDPTVWVECETFSLSDRHRSPVTIDVAWDDQDDDPNWTSVRVRTADQVEDVQSLLDLVRNSIFRRQV